MFGFCRDIPDCYNVTTDTIFGTKGQGTSASRCRIEGENAWRYRSKVSMYDVEHKELFEGIRQASRQQQRLHVHQHDARHPGPDGLLHRKGDHLGAGDEFHSQFHAARIPLRCGAANPAAADGTYPTAMPGITEWKS